MAALQDPEYVKLCARLASGLGISLASARRQVDMASARAGSRAVEDRRRVAQEMLDELDTSRSQELGALLQSKAMCVCCHLYSNRNPMILIRASITDQ